MTTTERPMFYQPVFGNDNGYASFDAVDVAAFTAPALRRKDAAIPAEQVVLKNLSK